MCLNNYHIGKCGRQSFLNLSFSILYDFRAVFAHYKQAFLKEVPIPFHSKKFKNPGDKNMLSNNLVVGTLTWDFKYQSVILSAEEANRPKPSACYMNDETTDII